MNKNRRNRAFQIGGVVLMLLGVSVGSYLVIRKRKNKTTPEAPNMDTGFRCKSFDYPLNIGTCHQDVGVLQRYLKEIHNADLGVSGMRRDGVDTLFGSVTEREANKFLSKGSFQRRDIEYLKTILKNKKI